jgi:hypothetical protein
MGLCITHWCGRWWDVLLLLRCSAGLCTLQWMYCRLSLCWQGHAVTVFKTSLLALMQRGGELSLN